MKSELFQNDQRLAKSASDFGCPESSIVSLRNGQKQSPEHVAYLDLLSEQVQQEAVCLPDAVAEFQGKPVIYFIDAESGVPDATERVGLQQRLANRGDHAVLAEIKPGEIILYPLNLDREELNQHGLGKVIRAENSDSNFLFHQIATGSFAGLDGQSKSSDPVFEEIRSLLNHAVSDLVLEKELDGLQILSMTGRALFFRFLVDRKIVVDDLVENICPAAKNDPKEFRLRRVFSTVESAAQTSAWLDITFNGDLLPLIEPLPLEGELNYRIEAYSKVYQAASDQSGGKIFHHLEAILRGWENIEGLQEPFFPGVDWHQLNFRHIPIGVLSQVYENFSHQVDRSDSKDRSVHYTPRELAKLLVDESLAGLDSPVHKAKILDPTCGAGVFLVIALRELVRHRWVADKERLGDRARRPSKRVIESILHNQICGFDVSESALRLAALGLYITVIELNEITTPPSAHHATKALQGLMLFDQRTEFERSKKGFVLGSLGDAVDSGKFDQRFDIVVGNPPWSVVKDRDSKTELNRVSTAIGKRVLKNRGFEELAKDYQNPSGVPDLPFLWRATEWVRDDGIIAFALDARFILKQTEVGIKAREAWLKSVKVTGILNGSDLEKTPVWGGHDQPWILLWNNNTVPDIDEHGFHYVSPIRENELSTRGEFRIDYQAAHKVTIQSVIENSWLLKALYLGSSLDVQVTEKLCNLAEVQSIGSFWKADTPVSCRGLDIRPFKERECPKWLIDLEVFDGEEPDLLNEGQFPTYRQRHGIKEPNNKRSESNFNPPVVCIRRGPGESRDSIKSYRLPDRIIAFSKNYFGYSAHWHPEPELLCALLHLIAHSQVFQHYCLMRSAQIGARKRIIDKSDIDTFPFPDIAALSKRQKQEAIRLADILDRSREMDWEALDAFTAGLFKLTKIEQQVVEDTVTFNGPYRVVRDRSMQSVPAAELSAFVSTLKSSIKPFFKPFHQKVKVKFVEAFGSAEKSSWKFVSMMLEEDEWSPSDVLIKSLTKEAVATAATRVVMNIPEGGLLVGQLNKRRFWTKTRARLCALHIAEEHLDDSFPLQKKS